MTIVDLRTIQLDVGERESGEYSVELKPFVLGGTEYLGEPENPVVVLTISQLSAGRVFELEVSLVLAGPCMRCLEHGRERVSLSAREYQSADPEDADELKLPYLQGERLDLSAWVRDEIALSLPEQILCRADCAGMCGSCGADLNTSNCTCPPPEPDSRWAKLADFPREAREISGK